MSLYGYDHVVVSATEAMATSIAGCSHQPITLAKRLEIIKAVESGRKSKSAIAQDFFVANYSQFYHQEQAKNCQRICYISLMPELKRLRLEAHSDI